MAYIHSGASIPPANKIKSSNSKFFYYIDVLIERLLNSEASDPSEAFFTISIKHDLI
jgi:hypothetical protein